MSAGFFFFCIKLKLSSFNLSTILYHPLPDTIILVFSTVIPSVGEAVPFFIMSTRMCREKRRRGIESSRNTHVVSESKC